MTNTQTSKKSNLQGGNIQDIREKIANEHYVRCFYMQLAYIKTLIQEEGRYAKDKSLTSKESKKLDELIKSSKIKEDKNKFRSFEEHIEYELKQKGLEKVIPYLEMCPSKDEFQAISLIKEIKDMYVKIMTKLMLPIELHLKKCKEKNEICDRREIETTLKLEYLAYYEKLNKVAKSMNDAINGIEFNFTKQTYMKLSSESDKIDYVKFHKAFLYNEASLKMRKDSYPNIRVDISSVSVFLDTFIRYLIILKQLWNDLFYYQMNGYVTFDRNVTYISSKKYNYPLEYVGENIDKGISDFNKHSLNLRLEIQDFDSELLVDLNSMKEPLKNYLIELERLRIN